jgi:hypothetical protein
MRRFVIAVAGVVSVATFSHPVGATHTVPSDCAGVRTTRSGTDGDDNINGTAGNDSFATGAGEDDIDGLASRDHLCGNEAQDVIDGDGGPNGRAQGRLKKVQSLPILENPQGYRRRAHHRRARCRIH